MSYGKDDFLDWDDEGLDLRTYIDFGIFVSSTLIKAGISGINHSNKSSYIVLE